MTDRQGEGAALLVGGYGVPEHYEATLHTLGRIGEALLATTTNWRIRRLSPLAGGRDALDRSTLKRHLTQLADQRAEVILVALAGAIATGDSAALITSDDHDDYPQDATLALDWIRDCLRTCRAPRALVVASVSHVQGAAGDGLAQRWLDALATRIPGHVVAIDPSQRRVALAALLAGLTGAALDAATGTTTMRSISAYLTRVVPGLAIQASDDADTLASVSPLAGPWDARLTMRPGAELAATHDPDRLVGTVLPGRVRIDRKLARGGFGTVYAGHQIVVGRDVAVKVLDDLDPGSDAGKLFVQEIQSVGRIAHRNVVRIYQADMTAGGRLFFAMELLSGLDLQQLIDRDGVMARRRAVGLVQQLLGGLEAAHDAGLVHADVKPANAFIVPEGDRERAVLLDFGLSRLRLPGRDVEAAGGTPAYMAPEQLRDGRVDSRSDLFAIALVLVKLLTGWHRRAADQLVPPLDDIDDAALRRILARALAQSPGERFQTAGELSQALGGAAATATVAAVRAPFRHLAAFTEADRDGLHGRERDIAALVEHVLYRRAVIYTAPSGTGKTSLLRAGLIARLGVLGLESVYLACRATTPTELAGEISPGSVRVADAIAARVAHAGHKLVVIVDQLEEALATEDALVAELASFERLPPETDVCVVLAVREDFLASLIAHPGFQGMQVVRLGPLTVAAARDAIVGTLRERRIAISDELLTELLADLAAAGRAIAPEMRWTQREAIYPPHLQLACSVLYEALGPGEATLTPEHYHRLGGLDAIVGEYLERVLDSELPPSSSGAAREILLALVNPNQTRAFCTETELAATVGERHDEAVIAGVLKTLRERGLVVPLRSPTGEPGWELVHDSVVPRVLAWIDRRDLARRRAVELVRHHVRRSRPDHPSLLSTVELRELRDHQGAVEELHAEWSRRGVGAISPLRLVQLSRRARRVRVAAVSGAVAFAVAIAGALGYRWLDERERRREEELLVKADLGRMRIELHAFDWDPATHTATPVRLGELPDLDWQLYEPDAEDRFDIGRSPHELAITRTREPSSAAAGVWLVEARGGEAVMSVSGRGRSGEQCAPSIIPLRRLPGFLDRGPAPPVVAVQVPTCRATQAGLITIPQGEYISGGDGDPRPTFDDSLPRDELPSETTLWLAEFAIDRTEVSNAAFAMFTSQSNATSVEMITYPPTPSLAAAGGKAYPVSDIEWATARAYCRFFGKDLPTSQQWEKAMRGGTSVNGRPNDRPRRNLPWGNDLAQIRARVLSTGTGPAPVGTTPGDVSPYGVLDLAGNVQEWTNTSGAPGFLFTRGCNWARCESRDDLLRFMVLPNPRPRRFHNFEIGFRCSVAINTLSAPGSSTR